MKSKYGHSVVIWDPAGEYWDGAIVDGARANQLRARGVSLLPLSPELVKLSGVGGYQKRSWGSGWPLGYVAPRMCCPLTLRLEASTREVHWMARLTAEEQDLARVREGRRFEGVLRFAPDPGQVGCLASGPILKMEPVNVQALGPPDEYGGWTVGSGGPATFGQAGHYGFGLYGMAPGLRVVWAAASIVSA